MITDIIPCVVVASMETDAFMAIVAYFDMLNGEIKDSEPMNFIPRKVEELGLNSSAGRTVKISGCTWYKIKFGKEKGNLEALSTKANLMSEILARLC